MFRHFSKFLFGGGFLARVSLFELAVGLLVLGAIQKLLSSLIGDIVMPLVAVITGGLSFSNIYLALSTNITGANLEEAQKQGPVLAYGEFLTILINFTILLAVLLPLTHWIKTRTRRDEIGKTEFDRHGQL